MPPSRDRTSWVTLRILGIGNLLGAIVSFFYFRFVDSSAAELPGVGILEIGFSDRRVRACSSSSGTGSAGAGPLP